MRYLVSLAVLLVWAIPVWAAPPTIKADKEVFGIVGSWVELKVEATGKWVNYRSNDQGLQVFPSELLKDSKKVLVSSTEAKSYSVIAYTGNDEGGADCEIKVTFVNRGMPGPFPSPPNPPTPPLPDPPAPNVIEGAWVIVVEETSQRTPQIASLLGEVNFWKSLPVAGVKFYDKDSPDAKRTKYDVMAQQTGINLPVMMIVDSKGKLVKAKHLPTSTTDVRTFIKETIGK